jgi:hypothetical protein
MIWSCIAVKNYYCHYHHRRRHRKCLLIALQKSYLFFYAFTIRCLQKCVRVGVMFALWALPSQKCMYSLLPGRNAPPNPLHDPPKKKILRLFSYLD